MFTKSVAPFPVIFWFLCLYALAGAPVAMAQEINDSLTTRLLNEANQLQREGNLDEAHRKYLQIFKSGRVLPDELCYYYGKNLYLRGNYEQSIKFFQKYDELTEKKGPLTDSVQILYVLADSVVETKKAMLALERAANQTVDPDNEIYINTPCFRSEKIICPVCQGAKVTIKKGRMSKIFQQCNHCDEHGFVTCTQYKRYLDAKDDWYEKE